MIRALQTLGRLFYIVLIGDEQQTWSDVRSQKPESVYDGSWVLDLSRFQKQHPINV